MGRFIGTGIFSILAPLVFFFNAVEAKETPSLLNGFGKAAWGMSMGEVVQAYQVVFKMPERTDPGGVWAFQGPAEGELTVSGEALGEADIRSVSFGIHAKYGLAIVHIRFKDANDPKFVEQLLPKWMARLGPPKEQLPGPKVIWTVGETHIELTYHTVSPRHPTPSDHLAIVNWHIPLMEKIEAEKPGEPLLPDVEKLAPTRRLHKEE